VCPDPACGGRALERRLFARVLRAPVILDPETLDFIDEWQRSEFTR
jgi:hypothetical protein